MRSEGPRCRPAVLDDSGLGQTSRDVDQLSQMIRDRVQGPAGLTHCPGNSGPCPSAHRVDQQSRETRDSEQGPSVAIRFPRRLGPESVAPRV